MYTPKFSTKRVLGLVMATALAVSSVVAVAGSSDAAAAALKLSPTTGSSAGATVVTITGKGFATASGTSKVGKVWFSTATCAPLASGWTNPVVTPNVVSATKLVVTTPVLALTESPKPTIYNICVQNGTLTASGVILGAGKFSSYLAPTINDQSVPASIGVAPVSGPTAGGSILTIAGENFTSKTTATVGGLPLTKVKVEIGSSTAASTTVGDDTLTGTVPAGTGATAAIVVTSEGGKSTAATGTFAYLETVKVSPASGNGLSGNGITLTGSGFSARVWSSTAVVSTAVIQLAKATTNTTATGPVTVVTYAATTPILCTNIQVENDTTLSCTLPLIAVATAAGGYTAQIVDLGGTNITAVSAISQSATYTVAAF